MDKQIGPYHSKRIRQAARKLGGFAELAKHIPSPKAKSGHIAIDWLRRLSREPATLVSDPARTRLAEALARVLTVGSPSSPPKRAARTVSSDHAAESLTIDGHTYVGSRAQLDRIVDRLFDK